MKPLKLKIKGLNSFTKEQTIDFEALSACGIFGIFGPTGSGKSTILDGITLALYGDVARKSSNFVNSSGEIQEAGIVFTFRISGKIPRVYQVERRYKKNKDPSKKPTCQSVLKELDGETVTVLEDGTSAVTAACERLIGLKKEDFLRTVVLPQGKFSEFLMLTGKERNEMLERLFHLEKYGETLALRIAGEKKRLALQIERLSGQLTGYESLSETVLEEKEQALRAERQEREALEKQLAKAEEEARAFQQIWTVQKEKERYEEELEQWRRQKPEAEELKQSILLAEEAGAAMPAILQWRQKVQQEEDAAAVWDDAKKALCRAQEEEKKAQIQSEEAAAKEAELMGLQEKKIRLEAAIPKMRAKLTLEEELDASRKKLELFQKDVEDKEQRKIEEENFLKESENALNQARRKLEEIQVLPAYRRAVQEGMALENEADGTAAEKEKVERELSERKRETAAARILVKKARMDQEKAKELEETARQVYQEEQAGEPVTEEDLRVLFEELQIWKQNWEKGSDYRHRREENQALFRKLTEELEAAQREKARLTQEGAVLDEKIRAARKLEKAETAENLRKTLQAGEPCPVCGSIHFNLELFHQEKTGQKEKAMGTLEDLEKQREENRRMTAAVEGQIAEKQAGLRTSQELAGQIELVLQSLPSLHIKQEPSMERYEAAKEARQIYQDRISRLRQNMEEARAAAEKSSAEVLKAENSLRLWEERESDTEEKFKNAEILCRRQKALLLKKRKELNILDFRQEDALIEEKDNQTERLGQQIAEIERERAEAVKKQDEMAAAMALSAERRIRMEARCEELYKKIENLRQEVVSIAGDTENLEKKKKEIEQTIWEILENSREAKEQLAEKRDRRNRAERAEETAGIQANHARQAAEESAARLEEVISGSPNLRREMEAEGLKTEETAKLFLKSEKELTALRGRLEAYREEGKRLENLMAEKERQLEGQGITEEEWKRSGEAVTEIGRLADEKKAEEILLANEVKEGKRRLQEKRELLRAQEKLSHRKALVDQLEKLVKGKRFVEYVAREKLQYVSREASVLLRQLTHGNYQLECSPEGKFVVIDYKNGGVRRAVNTLSGGEVFLASFSLALALSNQIQLTNRAPLELFFLDEGFGTLDDSLLDTVIDALENLRSLNRRAIGLITHVEKIQDQMPVKLLVSPGETGKRGSEVKLVYS